jgi:uncharacterized protein (DUF2267 family)
MNIQTLKLDLVERIIQTDNSVVLIKIKKLLQPEKPEDWWDELPMEVQESIVEGLNDIKEENTVSHEQVIREAKQKYGF